MVCTFTVDLPSSATPSTSPTSSLPLPAIPPRILLLSVAVELVLTPDPALAPLDPANRIVAAWLCGRCPLLPTNEAWWTARSGIGLLMMRVWLEPAEFEVELLRVDEACELADW